MTEQSDPCVKNPSSLHAYQAQWAKALLLPDGKNATETPDTWQMFLKTQGSKLAIVPQEQMALYDDLLLGSIYSTLEGIYPFCRKLFTSAQWKTLAESYRRQYPNRHFQLVQAVKAFPEFLKTNSYYAPDFLPELAWYEWVECEARSAVNPHETFSGKPNAPDPLITSLDTQSLESHRAVVNPSLQLLTLTYPIPTLLQVLNNTEYTSADDLRLACDAIRPATNACKIAVFRDKSLKVRYHQLSGLTPLLIEHLTRQHPNCRSVLTALYQSMAAALPMSEANFIEQATDAMNLCTQNNLLQGYQRIT